MQGGLGDAGLDVDLPVAGALILEQTRVLDLVGWVGHGPRSTIAKMHQRVRERLPQLPVLVEIADRYRRDQEALLAAAKATPVGETFEHAGTAYRRVIYKTHLKSQRRARTEVVLVEDPGTGETIDLTQREDEAFWSWAIIETLRHTGIRREELLEITHLALVSYRMADSGKLVPLLQIVPSKNNQERLLLVSPELASVLATIITRLRNSNGGTIPMTSRYDTHEGPSARYCRTSSSVGRAGIATK